MTFLWKCPFCTHNATITDSNFFSYSARFFENNKYGYQELRVEVITCPNPKCKEYTLKMHVHDCTSDHLGNIIPYKKPKETWQLIPAAEIKVFPDYIPEAIISDYKEACLIRDLSPKASATLARRCLQGMIRNFWKIKKPKLKQEIDELQNKIDPTTWAAIDAVRKIGNIGAHMEEDINLIIEVDPKEAKLLIGLIETLIKDWYIAKYERQKSMEQLVFLAEEKENQKA